MTLSIRSVALRRVLAVTVVAVVSLAACGSNSKSTVNAAGSATGGSGASATGGAAASPTAASTGVQATPTTKAATAGSNSSNAALGQALAAGLNAVAKGDCTKAASIDASMNSGASLTKGADTIADLANAMNGLSSTGPSDLRGDFKTLAKALGDLAQGYKTLGLDDPAKIAAVAKDPTKLAALEKLGQTMDAPEVMAADDHITQWIDAKCPGLGK